MSDAADKLLLAETRVAVAVAEARAAGLRVLQAAGCGADHAARTVDHLLDAELCGLESHGIMRVLQYADEFRSGKVIPGAVPEVGGRDGPTLCVDGRRGIGIIAMEAATGATMAAARRHGIAAAGLRNSGHTGRLGAFAESAAAEGLLFIACGGSGRQTWRMVAPYGGCKAVLPTNPWCLGVPGGDQGPVVLDFATGQVAGGWLYAARRAGALMRPGSICDRDGRPTQDPEDYFAGGAILPKGGALGYGLAVAAELICDAMLGPASVESNFFVLMVDTARYRGAETMRRAAEDILDELRSCPPAEGFERVEVAGERERMRRAAATGLHLPARTWEAIRAAAAAG